mmetsp:Transcript_4026/g.7000  ORF Transcript_4026/g.7000 Transcript_4026/m.7000 type:complete len:207 (+) Transcript_4026:274-894(+)
MTRATKLVALVASVESKYSAAPARTTSSFSFHLWFPNSPRPDPCFDTTPALLTSCVSSPSPPPSTPSLGAALLTPNNSAAEIREEAPVPSLPTLSKALSAEEAANALPWPRGHKEPAGTFSSRALHSTYSSMSNSKEPTTPPLPPLLHRGSIESGGMCLSARWLKSGFSFMLSYVSADMKGLHRRKAHTTAWGSPQKWVDVPKLEG